MPSKPLTHNFRVRLLAVLAMVGALFTLAPAAATAASTCQGATVTIQAVAGVTTRGSTGVDVIRGTSGPDTIVGASGDDIICGLGGDDTIYGQNGVDKIDGGSGNDRIYGGNGNDRLLGGEGNDYMAGQNNADEMYGGNGNDDLRGGEGNDKLAGQGGNDKLYGGNGHDRHYGGWGDDTIFAGAGLDTLRGDGGTDKLYGSSGNDDLDGGGGDDLVDGGSDTDTCAPETGTVRNCESNQTTTTTAAPTTTAPSTTAPTTTAPSTGTTRVLVRAEGAAGSERMRLYVNNSLVKTWTVSSNETNYIFNHSGAVNAVEIKYDNDASGRDLDVDYIEVGSERYQSEGDGTISTGTYKSGEGCKSRTSTSERLHCNGSFIYSINGTPTPPTTPPTTQPAGNSSNEVTVRAEGAAGSERMRLYVNDSLVKTWTVSSNEANYGYTHSGTVTAVEVKYDNDASGRDLDVDYVQVGTTRYQSEGDGTVSTGTYKSGEGCKSRTSTSERLHCNGSFIYNISGSTPPTTTTPPNTTPPSNGSHGCVSSCQTINGMLDLRNASNVTITNRIIQNPNGRCIDLTGASNVTLRNVTVRNCATNQTISSSSYDNGVVLLDNVNNITIENSLFSNIAKESSGSQRNNVIQVDDGQNITIRNSRFENVHSDISQKSGDHGNRAIKFVGNVDYVTIENNEFYNAGRNAIQFNRVRSAAGIDIVGNTIEGRGPWDSDYEDMINLYSSSGRSNDPIYVYGNTFKNGGPSNTGTGIILGDGNTSSGASQYIWVENNTFIDPGHVGINLAGGDHITVKNNRILGTADVAHWTTTGLTINHYGYSHECKDHTVTGNRVWMRNHLHTSGTGVNHTWIPGTCSNIQMSGNIWGDSSLLSELG